MCLQNASTTINNPTNAKQLQIIHMYFVCRTVSETVAYAGRYVVHSPTQIPADTSHIAQYHMASYCLNISRDACILFYILLYICVVNNEKRMTAKYTLRKTSFIISNNILYDSHGKLLKDFSNKRTHYT